MDSANIPADIQPGFDNQDKRAGGEDLFVLGVREFDLMRFFAVGSLWTTIRHSGSAASETSVARANQRVVDDWLAAIAENRDPICSGYAGMKALEVAMAVFAAGLARQRVELPLKGRQHPLRKWADKLNELNELHELHELHGYKGQ